MPTPIIPTTILSIDGSHRADLTPSPDGDGVWVIIKRVTPPFHTIGAWFLRCPYHLACDHVHAVVYPLTVADEPRLRYDDDLKRVVYSRGNPTTTRTRRTNDD